MNVLAILRRSALLIVVAAVVAGCTTPPDENRPGDLNCDGDRDGVPDGQSPVEGANETCDDGPVTPLVNETENPDDNETQPMPSVLP